MLDFRSWDCYNFRAVAPKTTQSKSTLWKKLRRIREEILAHVNSPLKPERVISVRSEFWSLAAHAAQYRSRKLAARLQVDVRQLQRYFRQEFGRSPQDWLNEQRIVAARKLLVENRSIKTVATDLGFRQPAHFSRHFKQHYGITPGEFLELHEYLTYEKPASKRETTRNVAPR